MQRAWSTSVGELLEMGFLLADFSGFCAMVGSSGLVFGFFFAVFGMLLRRAPSFKLGILYSPECLSRMDQRGVGHVLKTLGGGWWWSLLVAEQQESYIESVL